MLESPIEATTAFDIVQREIQKSTPEPYRHVALRYENFQKPNRVFSVGRLSIHFRYLSAKIKNRIRAASFPQTRASYHDLHRIAPTE